MSFTDKPARTNPSSILGGLPLAIPIGVMEILLVSMYILQPVHFSVFPSLLLIITLYRLALNVATTRLILLHGSTGEDAAGKVIQSFGQFVVGGNHVVGIVVFLVPMAIQYVVINHGAVRISEVTASFTLDAMPRKQMSIDADLNAWTINETEARQRREPISKEAGFYGAMDGAIRFTSRDAGLMGIPFRFVDDVSGLPQAGRGPRDLADMRPPADYLKRPEQIEKHLVLSASTKPSDMRSTADPFEICGPDHLLFTKLDETSSPGPILNELVRTGKCFSYYTDGQRVPDDLRTAPREHFRDIVLRRNNNAFKE